MLFHVLQFIYWCTFIIYCIVDFNQLNQLGIWQLSTWKKIQSYWAESALNSETHEETHNENKTIEKRRSARKNRSIWRTFNVIHLFDFFFTLCAAIRQQKTISSLSQIDWECGISGMECSSSLFSWLTTIRWSTKHYNSFDILFLFVRVCACIWLYWKWFRPIE